MTKNKRYFTNIWGRSDSPAELIVKLAGRHGVALVGRRGDGGGADVVEFRRNLLRWLATTAPLRLAGRRSPRQFATILGLRVYQAERDFDASARRAVDVSIGAISTLANILVERRLLTGDELMVVLEQMTLDRLPLLALGGTFLAALGATTTSNVSSGFGDLASGTAELPVAPLGALLLLGAAGAWATRRLVRWSADGPDPRFITLAIAAVSTGAITAFAFGLAFIGTVTLQAQIPDSGGNPFGGIVGGLAPTGSVSVTPLFSMRRCSCSRRCGSGRW